MTVKDGRNVYEKHEVQATTIEPKLKVEGTGAIEYVKTWGVQGRSEVWVGEQSGKTQDRGEVVPRHRLRSRVRKRSAQGQRKVRGPDI